MRYAICITTIIIVGISCADKSQTAKSPPSKSFSAIEQSGPLSPEDIKDIIRRGTRSDPKHRLIVETHTWLSSEEMVPGHKSPLLTKDAAMETVVRYYRDKPLISDPMTVRQLQSVIAWLMEPTTGSDDEFTFQDRIENLSNDDALKLAEALVLRSAPLGSTDEEFLRRAWRLRGISTLHRSAFIQFLSQEDHLSVLRKAAPKMAPSANLVTARHTRQAYLNDKNALNTQLKSSPAADIHKTDEQLRKLYRHQETLLALNEVGVLQTDFAIWESYKAFLKLGSQVSLKEKEGNALLSADWKTYCMIRSFGFQITEPQFAAFVKSETATSELKSLQPRGAIFRMLVAPAPFGAELTPADALATLLAGPQTLSALKAQEASLTNTITGIIAESNQVEEAIKKLPRSGGPELTKQLDPLLNKFTALSKARAENARKLEAVTLQVKAREANPTYDWSPRTFGTLCDGWLLYKTWFLAPGLDVVNAYRKDFLQHEPNIGGKQVDGLQMFLADFHFRQPDKLRQKRDFLRHILANCMIQETAANVINLAWNAERGFINARHEQLHSLLEVRLYVGAMIDNRFRPEFDAWKAELEAIRNWIPTFRKRHEAWQVVYRHLSSFGWRTPFDPPLTDVNQVYDKEFRKLYPTEMPNCTDLAFTFAVKNFRLDLEGQKAFLRNACKKETLDEELKIRNGIFTSVSQGHTLKDVVSLFNDCRKQIESNSSLIALADQFTSENQQSEVHAALAARELRGLEERVSKCLLESELLVRCLADAQQVVKVNIPQANDPASFDTLSKALVAQSTTFRAFERVCANGFMAPVGKKASMVDPKRNVVIDLNCVNVAGFMICLQAPDAVLEYRTGPINIQFQYGGAGGTIAQMAQQIRQEEAAANQFSNNVKIEYGKWKSTLDANRDEYQKTFAQQVRVSSSKLQPSFAASIQNATSSLNNLGPIGSAPQLTSESYPGDRDLARRLASLHRLIEGPVGQGEDHTRLRTLADVACEASAVAASKGDLETAAAYADASEVFLAGSIGGDIAEVALAISPLGWGVDLYEAVTGSSLIGGRTLTDFERGLAVFGVMTAGKGKLAVEALEGFARVLGKAKGSLAKAAEFAQRFRKPVGSIAKAGNKFVRELEPWEKYRLTAGKGGKALDEAFDGHVFRGTYEPGEILIQAQTAEKKTPGNWFGVVRPLDRKHAAELFQSERYGEKVKYKVYRVKERVSGYAGKVRELKDAKGKVIHHGSGHQFHIPEGTPLEDILEEIDLRDLP